MEAFETAGYGSPYLFAVTQSTTIGRETFFMQSDPRRSGQELLCASSSLQPERDRPFVNLEKLPKDRRARRRDENDACCTRDSPDVAGRP